MRKIPTVVSCLLLVVSLLGCARTVTSYVNYGSIMTVDVTLRGNMDATANRYFLVLARDPGYKVPLPPPDNIVYEMIEPGTTPRSGALADYYANYYSSWEGYCLVEPGGYFLVDGPFTLGEPLTREVIASLGTATTKLTFNFELSRLFGATIPETIYFDLITVPWPDDAARLPADHLAATDAYISKIAGSTLTVTDDNNPALADSLDITQCQVTIQ
ncbi:MAG: hypothetical protein MUC35_01600 [Candidatus Margulisbacteria bacterium]|jgi:hypothetical protein|nr:hypothetical protein [Candidatus Margulisiibacteriota bacterium]